MSFSVVSTFAGCGGSSTGYVWAGGKVLLAVEWDDNAVETYRLNYPETPIYHGDITKLSVEEALKLSSLKKGELDIFDGSPPCQGFSTAGGRNMNDNRNQLFQEYVRLLKGFMPKVFVMENVSGMVKGNMKFVFVEILKELKAASYNVKARLLNAKYYEVPQSRERMIFIGVRNDLGIEATHPTSAGIKTVQQNKESREPFCLFSDAEKANSILHKQRHLKKGNGFGFIELKSGTVAPTIGKTFIKQTSARFIDSDGNHYLPSSAELRQIASFPEQYKFAGDYKDQWNRIGNSVPPRFMYHIAKHINETILQRV